MLLWQCQPFSALPLHPLLQITSGLFQLLAWAFAWALGIGLGLSLAYYTRAVACTQACSVSYGLLLQCSRWHYAYS